MISKIKAQKYAGVFFLLFSILLYFYILPIQVIQKGHYGMSPLILPRTYAAILGVMSILLIFSSMSQEKKLGNSSCTYYESSRDEVLWIALIVLVTLIYIFLLEYLGYIISSFLALVCYFFIFNEKRWKLVFSVSLLLPVFVFFFFRLALKMYLPEGLIPIPF